MSADKFNSLIDVAAISAEQKALLELLGGIKAELKDTAAGAIALNNALLNSTSFKEYTNNAKAVTDVLNKQVVTKQKIADTETKIAAQREKDLNKYLILLSKQQAAEDAASAKRLAQLDKEMIAAQRAADKRKQVLQQDPSTYRGATGPELTNDQFNAGQDRTAALANEKAAIIANIEAEGVNSEAKAKTTAATIEENAALLELIENNIRLKAELAIVNAELKVSGETDVQLTAEKLRLTAAIRENNAVIGQHIKEEIAASGSNNEERATLEKLRLEYNALSAAEKENIEIGVKKLAQIEELDAKVKASASKLGKFGDNVGNYPDPEKAIVAQTSAIDKVIGRFNSLDKIGARVLQQLSRQVISLGVGLLSFAVGAKAIELIGSALFDLAEKYNLFGDKATLATEVLKSFNEVSKNVATDLGKSQTVFKVLADTAANTALSLKERTAAGAELIKQFPKELEGSTALGIANGEEKTKLDALSVSLIENAKARAALSKIEELQGKIIDSEFQKEKIRNAQSNESARLKKDIASGALDVGEGSGILEGDAQDKIDKRAKEATGLEDQNQKIIQGQIDFLTKYAGGESKIAKAIETDDKKKAAKSDSSDEDLLKKQAEYYKKIAEDQKESYDVRILASENYYKKENELADLQAKKAIKNGDNPANVAGAKTAQKSVNTEDFKNLNAKINADQIKKDLEAAEARYEIVKKNLDQLLEVQDNYSKKELEKLADNYAAEGLALAEKYKDGLLTEKQYQEQKAALGKTYAKLTTDEEIRNLQDRITIDEAFGLDAVEDQKKLDELKIKSNRDKNAQQIADDEAAAAKKIAIQKQIADGETEARKQAESIALDIIQNIVDASFKAAQTTLDNQSQAVDDQTKAAISAENLSLDSASQKAKKIAVIDAQATAQKKFIANQQKKIAHEQAVFDREISIARIVATTAENIVKAFPIVPLEVLAGAIGALEIAAILSTPLPAFAEGGEMKYTGLAKFGENGTELKIDPDGTLGLTPDTETIGMVKKGTTFVSNTDLLRMIAQPDRVQYAGGQMIDLSELVDVNKAMLREMKNKDKNTRYMPVYDNWNTTVNNYVN